MATYTEIKHRIEPRHKTAPRPITFNKPVKVSKKLEAMNLWLKGLTYSEIGQQLGFSRQYAQQIIAPPKFVREMVKERAKSRCEQCKVLIAYGHIHHKRTVGCKLDNFNDTDNLEYLCIGCHRGKHL